MLAEGSGAPAAGPARGLGFAGILRLPARQGGSAALALDRLLLDRLLALRGPGENQGGGPAAPEEPKEVKPRARSLSVVGATAALGLLLVAGASLTWLLTYTEDPRLAVQVVLSLGFVALASGSLAALGAWWLVLRTTRPLRRLARM